MRKDRVVSEVLGEESAITPSDLYNTEFRNALVGGYDKTEVDAFLERVADVFESLIQQVRELKARAESQKTEIETLREMEGSLRDALVTAQKFSENTVAAAKRQAEAILEEARLAKARAEIAAGEMPKSLRTEIEALQAARGRLRADLEAMLKAHAALLARIPRAEAVAAEGAPAQRENGDFAPDLNRAPRRLDIEREPSWMDAPDSGGNPADEEIAR